MSEATPNKKPRRLIKENPTLPQFTLEHLVVESVYNTPHSTRVPILQKQLFYPFPRQPSISGWEAADAQSKVCDGHVDHVILGKIDDRSLENALGCLHGARG